MQEKFEAQQREEDIKRKLKELEALRVQLAEQKRKERRETKYHTSLNTTSQTHQEQRADGEDGMESEGLE